MLLVVGLVAAHAVEVPGASGAWLLRDALIVCMFAPLAWRRQAPRLVMAIVLVAVAGTWIGRFLGGTTVVAGAVACYGVARHVARPASLRAMAAATAAVAAVAGVLTLTGTDDWYAFIARCSVVVAIFALGDSQQSRQATLAGLQAQAERAESLRVVEAQRAVAEERSRIAREMHDVVAHSLSVMVVQSVAAERLAAKDVAAAAASMTNVADVGRRALTEMRRIFDIFDDGSTDLDLAPQPTLADLDAIIDTFRSSGMQVTVERERCSPSLDSATELAIVRIVQESLTNVLKHSSGADVVVRLEFGEEVVIEVADNGAAGLPPELSDGRGRGLIGMRERVDSLGGTLVARRFAGRGFVVRATLPSAGAIKTRMPAPSLRP